MVNKKGLLTLGLFAVLVLGLLPALPTVNAQSTEVYVHPQESVFYSGSTPMGSRFNVSVWVNNVTDLFAWQVIMYYNSTILNCTRAWRPTWDTQYVFYGRTGTVSVGSFYEGWVGIGESLTHIEPLQPTFNGTGILCIFEFEIMAVPSPGEELLGTFDISKDQPIRTKLWDHDANLIPAIKTNGYYRYIFGVGGEPVASFTYTLNIAEFETTFNASDSYDPNGFIVSYEWDFGDGENGTDMIVTHRYSVRAAYVVKLTVTDNDGLTGFTTRTVSIGNLKAVSIEPVQVAWGVNLVQDKATDFKIGYESTFDVVIETTIRLDAPGFTPDTYQFTYKFAPGSHNFIIGNEHATSQFLMAHNKPEASFKFTIDPADLVVETDESDNTFPSTDFEKRTVTNTKPFNILFVAVRFDGEDGYPGYFNGYSRASFEEHAAESVRYLKATYPVAESEVSYYPCCFNGPVNAGPRPTTEAEAGTTFTTLLQTLALRAGDWCDRAVGVVRNDWFSGIPGWDGTIGFAGLGWGKGAVVTVGYWKTSPHEIGHTYNLGHSNDNGEGYYVVGRRSVNAQTFMSTGAISNPPAQDPYRKPVPDFWIRTVEYQALLTALTETADPEILLVRGTFWRNETVELGDWYRFPSGTPDYEEGSLGNYYVAQRDGLGNLLSLVGFNVMFDGAIHGHSFDMLPLAFTIPFASGAKVAQILNETSNVVATKNISDNAPTVHVLYPNGGETLTSDHVQVSWEASDLDSDPLVYNLLVSGDGGNTWNPVETGLIQTTFNLPLTGFSGGNNYIVKVIASDGANTAEDISDGSFTIASFTMGLLTSPQIVPLGSRANYTLNITSYGGFSNSITFDANSPTTDKLVFRWLNGSTIDPVPNGSTTVVVEVEVLDGAEGGNHTLIFSGASGNNTEVAIAYIFASSHDIAVSFITASKNIIGQGFCLTVKVTVHNHGYFGETITVSLKGNQTKALNQSTHLSTQTSKTLTIVWNTSGFAKGNYTISAYAHMVEGETDKSDNTIENGWVVIAMAGDISGPEGLPDRIVDIDDVMPIALAYATSKGTGENYLHSPPCQNCPHSPNCDITNDGIIDIDDVIIPAIHFGETDP